MIVVLYCSTLNCLLKEAAVSDVRSSWEFWLPQETVDFQARFHYPYSNLSQQPLLTVMGWVLSPVLRSLVLLELEGMTCINDSLMSKVAGLRQVTCLLLGPSL